MVRGKAGPRPGPVKKKAKADKPKADKKKPDDKVAKVAETVDRDRQRLAIAHRDAFVTAQAQAKKAAKRLRDLAKTVKADGFTMKQIKIMAELATPEGEAAVKLSVMQTLEAAKWSNSPLGAQLDLFGDPDRTPAVDMAFEEGIADAMASKPANPGYAPSLPQHARYMEGYHEEQARQVQKGIKKLDPDEQAARATVLADARKRAEDEAKRATVN